ncbi:MAG TPA: hypothetical protein VK657_10815, partial [Terriglobales bacterium]|nr:hypothetical protein [Terriglobales bacterium]
SRWTFRAWKAKYGAAIDAETDRLKQLELENAHLRRALARASSDLARLRRLPASASKTGYLLEFDSPVASTLPASRDG